MSSVAATPLTAFANSPIAAQFREKTSASRVLAEEAQAHLPSGITHDSRRLRPYGVYMERAAGSRKWDVDGNEYVDYFGGHGALLLGHNHPQVLAAMHQALDAGTHFGSNHKTEVEWAATVKRLIPCAELVRFTSSGTEATHLALRLARAHTGRSKLIRFRSHFHGWHDHMASGYNSHYDGSASAGVLPGITEGVILVEPGDLDGVQAALATGEVAGIILEPTGSSFGLIPLDGAFLHALRELTAAHRTLLIFDEVVTGFRVSRGGAQAHFGVTPDLTTLAKILAGGLPGGAVVGRQDILEALDFDMAPATGREKIQHQGTYNANPVSAAAGLAALKIIEDTDACDRANAYGERIRARLNDLLSAQGIPWAAYGTFSGFHLFTNAKQRAVDPHQFDPTALPWQELKANPPDVVEKLRLAMLINGVDLAGWPGGVISAVHSDEDLELTIEAFGRSFEMLKAEGDL